MRNTKRSAKVRRSSSALLILDLISDFEFEDGARILRAALPIAKRIAALKRRMKRAGIPVIYVNDEPGDWNADRDRLVNRCLQPQVRGRAVVELLIPAADDFFVFKPKHSGFYGTPLNELLQQLQIKELILTGVTSHQCVLFTAVDAYVRDYTLTVPRDCISAVTAQQTKGALYIFETALKARLTVSTAIRAPTGR